MSQEQGMRAWLPSQVYRDEAHAASVLAHLISQCNAPATPRLGPYVLGVQLRSSGALVGHVGFSPFAEAVEVGFAVEGAHQRRGIAAEAVRAASHWASKVFCLDSILGITAAKNVASQGMLLRAGFTWLKDEVMPFQGFEQPVMVFVFGTRPLAAAGLYR
jgi:RimJ/RimL family protein N-acetyltransferase